MFRHFFILLACFYSFSSANTITPSLFTAKSCMNTYDQNQDGKLDWYEFSYVCYDLFSNDALPISKPYPLLPKRALDEIFGVFDRNSDSYIDFAELTFCHKNWIETIIRPRSAFVVIDVQNDFISGSLNISPFPAKHNGKDVISPINKLLNTVNFTKVYYSLDWHPNNHVSFIDNVSMRKVDPSSNVSASNAKVFDTVVFKGPPKMAQRLWPRHCVQGTWGAKLHKDLKVVKNSVKIHKGTNPDVDSYSVFWDNNKLSETALHSYFIKEGITDVYVAGLAYDVCVGASAMDAQNLGYRTILIADCSRGVDPEGINATRHSVWMNHGVVAYSNEVEAMVKGLDRKPELGYKLALELKKNKNQ